MAAVLVTPQIEEPTMVEPTDGTPLVVGASPPKDLLLDLLHTTPTSQSASATTSAVPSATEPVQEGQDRAIEGQDSSTGALCDVFPAGQVDAYGLTVTLLLTLLLTLILTFILTLSLTLTLTLSLTLSLSLSLSLTHSLTPSHTHSCRWTPMASRWT